MTAPVRAAIVGAGFMGGVHARAVRAAGAVLVGVADNDLALAQALQAKTQAERATARATELIEAPDIDVVHVCTPNATHIGLVEQALRAGKHVVCEKPLATSPGEAAGLEELADKARLVGAVPFVYRFYPMVREVRERVRRGEAGRLSVLHGYYLQDWLAGEADDNWRVDAGRGGRSRAFGDIGVHWVDLVEFASGQRLVRLGAQLLTVYPRRQGPGGSFEVHTEDAATVSFETDGGAIGSVVLNQVAAGRKNRFRFSFDGTEASFAFDHDRPEQLWVGGRSESRVLVRSPEDLAPAAAAYVTVPAGHPQGYQDCFNAFVADCYTAVRGGSPDGLPRFCDGRRAAEVTEAVLVSAASKSWVEVPPVPSPSVSAIAGAKEPG
ncbi:MAG: Gfo/Idh/MocA family oxidoreductase [Acidimicrobiales bacterium]|jgi:predicted dehydrogenase